MTGNDKPRRRRLSEDEHALWRGVTRSIAPLKRRPPMLLADAAEAGATERKAKAAAPKRGEGAAKRAVAAPLRAEGPPSRAATAPKSTPPVSPALMPLERRLKQRLARGTDLIDARVDLHGKTQGQAHGALLRFLRNAQADGAKTVLVITGKGARGACDVAGERGVLRRQVPLWLALPEFRVYVAGVEEAHGTHGGQGALYVRVRRRRSHD